MCNIRSKSSLQFPQYIQKSNVPVGTGKTIVPTTASSEDENLSADPDEAIRRRLAELRTEDSCTGKSNVITKLKKLL